LVFHRFEEPRPAGDVSSAKYGSKAELREMLRQPGRHYSLELKRGAETISVELKTRRLL
jgi:hypothetical protein